MLNDAALEAAKQWQDEPTLLNGTPVPVIMTATVNFTLCRRARGWRRQRAGAQRSRPATRIRISVAPDRVGPIWIGMPVTALVGAMPPRR